MLENRISGGRLILFDCMSRGGTDGIGLMTDIRLVESEIGLGCWYGVLDGIRYDGSIADTS